jgi:hypothetical protein
MAYVVTLENSEELNLAYTINQIRQPKISKNI